MAPQPLVAEARQRASSLKEKRTSSLGDAPAAPKSPFHPQDRLSRLPPELLALIFEQVRLCQETPMRGGISRLFRPFVRINFFDTVEIKSYKMLELFVRGIKLSSFQKKNHIAALIKSFTFTFDYDDDLHVEYEMFTPSIEAKCGALFRSLVAAERVVIDRSVPIMQMVLSTSMAKSILPSMKVLDLRNIFDDGDANLFDSNLFVALPCYARLEKLVISITSNDELVSEFLHHKDPVDALAPPSQIPNIKVLEVSGACSDGSTSLARFLSLFQSLETLTVDDEENSLNFNLALQHLPPSPIKNLTLFRGYEDFMGDWQLEQGLKCLPNLVTLKFGATTYSLATFPLLFLCRHLEEVTFDEDEMLTKEGILMLLHGPKRPPFLQKITLFVDEGMTGCHFSHLEAVPDHDLALDLGWARPDWYQLSLDDFLYILEVSKRVGISIAGTVQKGIDNLRAYENEISALKRRLAEDEKAKNKADKIISR